MTSCAARAQVTVNVGTADVLVRQLRAEIEQLRAELEATRMAQPPTHEIEEELAWLRSELMDRQKLIEQVRPQPRPAAAPRCASAADQRASCR